MSVRSRPLGAYDCEGCTLGWHLSRVEVERCERGRVQRLTERVKALHAGVMHLRLSRAHSHLRRTHDPR